MFGIESHYVSPRALLFALLVAVCGLQTLQSPLRATQPCSAAAPPCVLTSQNGNLRQSWNANETLITPTSLQSPGLTKLTNLTVDKPPNGYGAYNPIYAQPLYVAGMVVNPSAPSPGAPQNCPPPSCNMLVAVTLAGSIWAWNADTGKTIFSRTGLAVSDCLAGGVLPTGSDGGNGSTPFAGIVSTPVIDPTIAIPTTTYQGVMFLTNVCMDLQNNIHWYLHAIDLTNNLQDVPTSNSPLEIRGSSNATAGADDFDLSTQTVPFKPRGVLQRSALLEVPDPLHQIQGITPAIYFSFGTAVPEGLTNTQTGTYDPYHGWIFAYTFTSNQLSLLKDATHTFPFATTTSGGSGTASPPCNICPLPVAGCVPTSGNTMYPNAPNWCGHGGGVWMSSRGPAAQALSGVPYIYYGAGNGGFQNSGLNWGETIMGFRLQASGADYVPYQSFTPHGGPYGCGPTTGTLCQPALQPPLGTNCPNETGTNPPGLCQSTVEAYNENDWDMATSGILLFDDQHGNHRLVTVDKAGYGHLFTQGQLCASPPCAGFALGDPGDWPFGALATNLCDTLTPGAPSNPDNCHRITSLAFHNNTLYYWPKLEELTSLQVVPNIPTTPLPTTGGTVYTETSGGYVHAHGTACNGGGACFTGKVIPGNLLIINGCTASADPAVNTCPTITSVRSDTELYLSFDPSVAQPGLQWSYAGYLMLPDYDPGKPAGTNVLYPGAAVAGTSSSNLNGVVWGLGTVANSNCPNGVGVLHAYDAGTLNLLWTSNTTGALFRVITSDFDTLATVRSNASFALPTIVNGNAYVPTYGINTPGTPCSQGDNAAVSGILVFCNPNSTACNGHWQQ